jgi:hypothetical protein
VRTLLGYTWVGWLNILLLQWFGFRVFYVLEGGRATAYGLTGPTLPLTGWWGRYLPQPRLRVWLLGRVPVGA